VQSSTKKILFALDASIGYFGVMSNNSVLWTGFGVRHEQPPPLGVWLVDPPWRFRDGYGPRGSDGKYGSMSLDELKAMPLPPLAKHCALFLWRVTSQQEEAFELARAWGFEHSGAELVWVKYRECALCAGLGRADLTKLEVCHGCGGEGEHRLMANGWTLRASHETCLIFRRGRPKVLNNSTRSVIEARLPIELVPRTGKKPGMKRVSIHSAKPEVFAETARMLFAGPYGESFARYARPGWWCSGKELGMFHGVDAGDRFRVDIRHRSAAFPRKASDEKA